MHVDGLREEMFGRFLGFLLGEEDLSIKVAPDLPDNYSSVRKTGYGAGYRIEIRRGDVVIRRVDRLALLAGFPPMHYFRGVLRNVDERNVLMGRIRMVLVPRLFIMTWAALMSFALLTGVVVSAFSLLEYWVSPGGVSEERMLGAGAFTGMVATVGALGAMIIGVVRWMSNRQRDRLKRFCIETMERLKSSGNGTVS